MRNEKIGYHNEFTPNEILAGEFYDACITSLKARLKDNPKIAIVIPGGAMKGSWILWAIAWLKEAWICEKDISLVLWPSASSGSLAYFVSWQFDEWKKIWLNGLSDNKKFLLQNAQVEFLKRLLIKRLSEWVASIHKFFSPIIWIKCLSSLNEFVEWYILSEEDLFYSDNYPKILDVTEVIRLFSEDITNETWVIEWVQLDFDAFKNSQMTIVIPVRNADTGEKEYFSNKECEWCTLITSQKMMLEVLQATKTVPLMAGAPVYIGEKWKYDDGSFADPLPIWVHPTLSCDSINLGHILISKDGQTIRDDVLPIVLIPDNALQPNNQRIRSFTKRVVNILDSGNRWDILDKGEQIYTSEYLEMLQNLAKKWKIVLIFHSGKKISKLDNSKAAIQAWYESWKQVTQNNPLSKLISVHITSKKPQL